MMVNLIGPNAFSNLPHEYVCKSKTDSLFFIYLSVKQSHRAQVLEHLRDKLNETAVSAMELVDSSKTETGFVVGESDNTYSVVTCAHILEAYYSAWTQISLQQLNLWFQVLVVCQHYQEFMMNSVPDLYDDPNIDLRVYTPAAVVKFDQTKDLMLLSIRKDRLYFSDTDRCNMLHPTLQFASRIPEPLNDVTMISWPPCRRDTPVIGQMSSKCRLYGQITRDLSKGYNMCLFELDITGDNGSSGAPVLNQHGKVVALYHGRLNSVGYGVSSYNIRQFCQIEEEVYLRWSSLSAMH